MYKTKVIAITRWDQVPILVDIPYVADLFKISVERVRQLCVDGTIPAFKIAGTWRITKQALMRICGIDENEGK